MGQGMSQVIRIKIFKKSSNKFPSNAQVLPGVYVTSALVARQGKVLDEFGITHVISVQAKPINPFQVIR